MWRHGTGAPLSPRRQQTFLAITHRHSQPQYVSRLDVVLVFQTCDNITVITRRIRCTQFWALACILSWTSPHISGWESCSAAGFSILLGFCGHLAATSSHSTSGTVRHCSSVTRVQFNVSMGVHTSQRGFSVENWRYAFKSRPDISGDS